MVRSKRDYNDKYNDKYIKKKMNCLILLGDEPTYLLCSYMFCCYIFTTTLLT